MRAHAGRSNGALLSPILSQGHSYAYYPNRPRRHAP